MTEIRIRTLDGDDTTLDTAEIEAFDRSLDGDALVPGEPGYDEARTVWNAMVDRRPGLVARGRSAEDAARAVDFARDHGALLAIRGGGHNIAGNAVCDGGILLDLSAMKDVRVDPAARTARVGPGASLGDFDGAAQAHGLATPLGINATTGVAGLTLGGGFGWLTRKHGMTVDNLRSARVVTADGESVTASADEHPDLFWGLRGGGGNLGVVTEFEFELHPTGPEILSGLVVHPFDAAPEVLRAYREFVADLPDETTCWFVLRKAPPLPFLPEEVHGKEIVILACFHAGDAAEGERVLGPIRAHGDPIADVVAPHAYVDWQQTFDPLLGPGARNYWKSHNFTALSDAALGTMIEYAARLPTPQSEIFVARLGGAANRVEPEATAYAHRDAEFVMNVHTRWEEPGDDERSVAWAREFFEATAPEASGSVYVNFMPEDEADRVRSAYGPAYDRLARVKAEYDPDNLFRVNQNVQPATG